MTLFTLERLLRANENNARTRELFLREIRQSYLDWHDTQNGTVPGKSARGWLAREKSMRALRGPGNTCLSALRAGGIGSLEEPANDSKGCGGVMRVAPVGLMGHDSMPSAVFRLGAESAALTHGHASGYLSAGVMAVLVQSMVQGRRLELYKRGEYDHDPLAEALSPLGDYANHEETLEAVNRALTLAREGAEDRAHAVESLGGGWVGEQALAIAVYAVLSARSFVEAITIAANHSGDSDSTACLAGQLWGAAHGLGGMPHDWIVDLDVLLPLLRLAKQLIVSEFR
jgi:ADP-ribosylglycohydrolase